MNPKLRWIFSSIAIVALVSLAVIMLAGSNSAAGKQSEQAPTPIPADLQVEQMRAALQSEELSEAARRSLQEKLAMAEQMAAEQAAGAQLPRRDKVAPPLPAAALENQPAPVQEGIFEGSQGLIRPSSADIRNVWQGERDGVLLQVFAGSLPDDPAQGIVVVVQASQEDPVRTTKWIRAPVETGALQIIEARDSLLIMTGEDGTLLTFNLVTLSFQD